MVGLPLTKLTLLLKKAGIEVTGFWRSEESKIGKEGEEYAVPSI